MTKKHLFILLTGVVMILSLLKAFGMSGASSEVEFYPRQINLSGNVFQFKIPEDFSKDMPAEDLIEQIDLEGSASLQTDGYVTLMRRWWDIRESGIFGKNMGAIMMSINVRKKPENQAGILKAGEYDFHQLLHFVVALYDDLIQRWYDHNEEVARSGNDDFRVYVPALITQVGGRSDTAYEGVVRGKRKWIDTGAAQSRQVYNFYALPLNIDFFLEIEFSLMPNDNIIAREFVDLAMLRINKIAETFDLQYAKGNEFDKLTSVDWMNKTVVGELTSNNDQFRIGIER